MMKTKKTLKICRDRRTKTKSRKKILEEFIGMEHAILFSSLSDAIIQNQKLILTTLLDIRDKL